MNMTKSIENGASLDFESQLCQAADALRLNIDASEHTRKMDPGICRINANIGPERADNLHRDLHSDFKADHIRGVETGDLQRSCVHSIR